MKKLAGLSIILAVVAVVVGVIVFYPQTTEKPVQNAVNAPQEPLNADKIFELVNQERIKAGVAPLIRDARLDASAQFKADDMATNNYFDHISPLTGKHGYELIKAEECTQGGENIIKVDDIGGKNGDALKWWLNSKPHHDAILDAKNVLSGIAVNGNIGVQHFCQTK